MANRSAGRVNETGRAKGLAAGMLKARMTREGGKKNRPRISAEGSKAYTGKLPGERKRQREREAETGYSA